MYREMEKWLVVLLLGICGHFVLAEEMKPTPSWMFPPEVLVFGDVSMIPLTPLAEQIGATLSEDVLTHKLSLARKGQSIAFTWYQTTALQNGKAIELAKAPFPRHHVTYVPLRQCIEALGGTVKMDEENHLAEISLPGMETTLSCGVTAQEGGSDAFRDFDTELFLVNLDGTGYRRLTYTDTDEEYPTFFSNSNLLVYVAAGGLAFRDMITQENWYIPPQEDEGEPIYFSQPEVASDNSLVVFSLYGYADDESRIGIFTVEKGVQVLGKGKNPRLSPDGKFIAYTQYNPKTEKARVHLMDTSGKHLNDLGEGWVNAFSPDGALLVVQRTYKIRDETFNGLVIYKLKKTRVEKVYELPPTEREVSEEFGGFNPDGSRIVLTRGDGVYVMKYDRSALQQLRCCMSTPTVASFTPDGEHILFAEPDGFVLGAEHMMIMDADGSNAKLLTPTGDGITILHYAVTLDRTQVIFEAYQH